MTRASPPKPMIQRRISSVPATVTVYSTRTIFALHHPLAGVTFTIGNYGSRFAGQQQLDLHRLTRIDFPGRLEVLFQSNLVVTLEQVLRDRHFVNAIDPKEPHFAMAMAVSEEIPGMTTKDDEVGINQPHTFDRRKPNDS